MLSHIFTLDALRTKVHTDVIPAYTVVLKAVFLGVFLFGHVIIGWFERPDLIHVDSILAIVTMCVLALGGYIGFKVSDRQFSLPVYISVLFSVYWRITILTTAISGSFLYLFSGPERLLDEKMIYAFGLGVISSTVATLLFVLPLAIQHAMPKPS